MTRFSSLEFEDDKPPVTGETGPQPTSRDENYYIQLADEKFRSADFEQALRFFSRALEFNPNLEPAWIGQVRMLVELGELKEAALWADKALDIMREHPDLLAAKGVVNARLGNRRKALEYSDAAAQSPNASAYVWLARGEVLLATHGRNADFCLEKAKTLAGTDWFTCLCIGRIYYFYRHYAKAMANVRKSIDLFPSSAFAWLVLGNLGLSLRLWKDAETAYEQALSLDPQFNQARVALNQLRSTGFFRRHFPFLCRLLR